MGLTCIVARYVVRYLGCGRVGQGVHRGVQRNVGGCTLGRSTHIVLPGRVRCTVDVVDVLLGRATLYRPLQLHARRAELRSGGVDYHLQVVVGDGGGGVVELVHLAILTILIHTYGSQRVLRAGGEVVGSLGRIIAHGRRVVEQLVEQLLLRRQLRGLVILVVGHRATRNGQVGLNRGHIDGRLTGGDGYRASGYQGGRRPLENLHIGGRIDRLTLLDGHNPHQIALVGQDAAQVGARHLENRGLAGRNFVGVRRRLAKAHLIRTIDVRELRLGIEVALLGDAAKVAVEAEEVVRDNDVVEANRGGLYLDEHLREVLGVDLRRERVDVIPARLLRLHGGSPENVLHARRQLLAIDLGSRRVDHLIPRLGVVGGIPARPQAIDELAVERLGQTLLAVLRGGQNAIDEHLDTGVGLHNHLAGRSVHLGKGLRRYVELGNGGLAALKDGNELDGALSLGDACGYRLGLGGGNGYLNLAIAVGLRNRNFPTLGNLLEVVHHLVLPQRQVALGHTLTYIERLNGLAPILEGHTLGAVQRYGERAAVRKGEGYRAGNLVAPLILHHIDRHLHNVGASGTRAGTTLVGILLGKRLGIKTRSVPGLATVDRNLDHTVGDAGLDGRSGGNLHLGRNNGDVVTLGILERGELTVRADYGPNLLAIHLHYIDQRRGQCLGLILGIYDKGGAVRELDGPVTIGILAVRGDGHLTADHSRQGVYLRLQLGLQLRELRVEVLNLVFDFCVVVRLVITFVTRPRSGCCN